MKIKRNSWLYKTFIRNTWNESFDVCTLMRSVIGSLTLFAVLGTMGAAVLFGALMGVGDTIAWLVFMLINGSLVEPGPWAAGVVVFLLMTTMLAIIFGFTYLLTKTKEREAVRAVYGAVSGKFCTKVEFE